ncbi:MAG: ferritin-like domain-containing protein [Tissierellia bacterium]|nr:ferritin-like domain-containing protein [Tissierellia bacterium]
MAQDYLEPFEEMSEKNREYIRALSSLREEIEAVDWYTQRVAVSTDEELKKIMYHNAMEEIEHAVMTLEWLRRNMDGWDEEMRTYLFTEASIVEVEEMAEGGDSDSGEESSGDLGIREL